MREVADVQTRAIATEHEGAWALIDQLHEGVTAIGWLACQRDDLVGALDRLREAVADLGRGIITQDELLGLARKLDRWSE